MNMLRLSKRFLVFVLAIGLVVTLLPAQGSQLSAVQAQDDAPTLTIYSGRNENLVGPLIEQFEQDSGIQVEVRYGSTSELALQIIEEGENSPADVFFAQDAGALGLLAEEGLLAELPEDTLDLVEPRFRSAEGEWVGVSGRARTFVYNTDALNPEDLPDTIIGFTDEEWEGRLGWAPTNASFQSFVTGLRIEAGEEAARNWLQDMLANDIETFPGNTPIVAATAAGEIEGGFVNHYYAYRLLDEDPDAPVANYFFPEGDIGSMINVAGVGILQSSENQELAQRFVLYLLSSLGQSYFAEETFEYSLLSFEIENEEGETVREYPIPPASGLPPLNEIETPEFDLSDLADLTSTLELLEDVNAFDE
jgi:iron(III) transport system substrate-binding protein